MAARPLAIQSETGTPPMSTEPSVASSKWSETFNFLYSRREDTKTEKEDCTAGLHTREISKHDSHYDYRAFYQTSKCTSEKLHGTIAIGNSRKSEKNQFEALKHHP